MTLAEYYNERGWKPHDKRSSELSLASGIGCEMLRAIVTGRRRPSLKVAIAIEDATNGQVTVRELAGLSRQPSTTKENDS
tara:strand:+ start:21 stop:260 length:240 start_codon:yes stop_codon:yes gene_type:complete